MAPSPSASWLRLKSEEAGFRSFDKLAAAVLEEWKRLAPRSPRCSARSLGGKIGGLDRPEPRPEILTWWSNKPVAEQALAVTLGVPVEDLPTKVGGASASRLYPLAELAEFRPFDPLRERPLRLGTPDLFEPVARADGVDRDWVVVPPGAGKSMAVHWFRTRGEAVVREVRTLSEVRSVLDSAEPLVIAVEETDPTADASIANALASRGGVRVLAPFPPPRLESETAGLSELERALKSTRPRWKISSWAPTPGWRRSYVAWLADRTTGDKLDASALLEWIERNDPAGTQFPTPGDIIPLAALATVVAPADFPELADLADRFVEERVEKASTWLRAHAADTLSSLAGALVARIDVPWRGPLSREVWAGLLPSDLVRARLDDRELKKVIDSVAKPRGVDARKKAAKEAQDRLALADPLAVVRELEESHFLRPAPGGGLALHPSWLAHALARRHVARAFSREPTRVWGRWAIGRVRSRLVDAAIDALDEHSLLRLVRKAVEEWDRTSLGSVAAMEALFAAVGRRLTPERPLSSPWLGRLAALQIGMVASRGASPLTRAGLDGWPSSTDWLASCWAWGICTPPPQDIAVPGELAWLFPRWMPVRLETLPIWCTGLGWGASNREAADSFLPREVTRAVRRARRPPAGDPSTVDHRMMSIAPLVIALCPDQELPKSLWNINGYLAVAAILATPKWRLPPDLMHDVLGSRWAGLLAEHLKMSEPDRRHAVADAVWSCIAERGAGFFAILDELWRSPALYDEVVEHVSEAAIDEVLARHGFPGSEWLRKRSDVPPRLLRFVARWSIDNAGEEAALLLLDAESAKIDDLAWIERLLDRFPKATVRALWRLAPARALDRALAAPPERAAGWFDGVPADTLPTLLERAEGWPTAPKWLGRWLRGLVAGGGVLADRAYALLHAHERAAPSGDCNE